MPCAGPRAEAAPRLASVRAMTVRSAWRSSAGVPPTLGGGGLETQVAETRAALERRGHEAFLVARQDAPRPFDVLHAIGARARRLRLAGPLAPQPGAAGRLARARRRARPRAVELVAARVPLRSYGPRLRAGLLRRADLSVAQTAHEEGLLRRLGARRTTVVPNGVTPIPPTAPPAGTPETPYVLMLGSVSARKRQAETVAALPAGLGVVVAGGFDGTAAERAAFERAVEASGATWLGEVRDPGAVRALLRGARALVHLSSAEGQALALLESLHEGTPVIVSPLPANRELAARHPGHVRVVDGPEGVAAALAELERGGARPAVPAIPTWDDVAATLERSYREVVGTAR